MAGARLQAAFFIDSDKYMGLVEAVKQSLQVRRKRHSKYKNSVQSSTIDV